MTYVLFLLKKCGYSHFFSKNTCALDIVLTRTFKSLTTNDALNNWAQDFNCVLQSMYTTKYSTCLSYAQKDPFDLGPHSLPFSHKASEYLM